MALAQAWMHFVEEAGKESAVQRHRAAAVLRLLIEFLNDVLSFRLGGVVKQAEPADQHALEQLASRASPDVVLALLERCLEAEMQLDRRVQLVLILEALTDALGQKVVAGEDMAARSVAGM